MAVTNDLNKLIALKQLIQKQGLISGQPRPLVTLEEFFDGNFEDGSIATNLPWKSYPGISKFFDTLKSIRARPNVLNVLIEINDVEDANNAIWPYSDRVYIFTTATLEEIKIWAQPIQPDEIEEGYEYDHMKIAQHIIYNETKIYSLWWD